LPVPWHDEDEREYRYSPSRPPGSCSRHPGCVLLRCARWLCPNTIHRWH